MSLVDKMGYIDSLKIGKSPVVDSWMLMGSPWPLALSVLSYLLVVLLGPRLMRNRQPMQLTTLITYYNAFQVVLSLVVCYKALSNNLFRDGVLYAGCRYPGTTQNLKLLEVGWWYHLAKFTELLDTVFFILRKKDKQVTFLHVYHHTLMALYSWSYSKYAGGGQGAVMALLNSAVHVIMYTYYFLAGLGPRYQKYLWWKKYVTKIQLTQFVVMLMYCVWTHITPRCQFTSSFTYFISINISVLLLLFLNFYTKSYRGKASSRQRADAIEAVKDIIKNGKTITNGVSKNTKKLPSLEDENTYEVKLSNGDYPTNGKLFLTRRTAKAAYGSECDFNGTITK